jgi:hypothetical protein
VNLSIIPAWIISLLALICALDYLGQFLFLRPINYGYLAKTLTFVYLSAIYLIAQLQLWDVTLRQILIRYGIGFVLLNYITFAGIDHWKAYAHKCSYERKQTWICFLHRRHNADKRN